MDQQDDRTAGAITLPEGRDTIIITGIGGRLGRLLAQRLHRALDVRIIGLDRRHIGGLPKDVEHVRVDVRSRRARDLFRGDRVAAVVHLGLMHNPRASTRMHHTFNVRGTAQLLSHVADFNVPKAVVLSSADVYGASPEHSQFLGEDAPLMGAADFPELRALISADMQATSFFWKSANTNTVVLRPVHILGRVNNAASNYFRLSRVPTLLGYDPMMQVIHEFDVIEAIMCALAPAAHGVFNVVGPSPAPLSSLIGALGKPAVPIPAPVAGLVGGLLYRARVLSFPVPELAYIKYQATVDGRRARQELGFRSRFSISETMHAALG